MDKLPEKQFNYTTEIIITVGYLLFFCVVLTLCYTFYIFTFLKQAPAPINTFATSLPAVTPSPQVSTTDQPEAGRIFEDNFSNDHNNWTLKKDIFKEEVANGKLYFESLHENNYAFTGCEACPYLKEPFYLQADFATTAATDKNFGIVFNLNYDSDSFYVFLINIEARKYYFYHRSADNWSLRAAGESDQIKSFPAVNTLGVYANQNTVEFYVNGKIIDSYKQSGYSFHVGDFAFYVDNANFKLVVDNLVIKNIGN